MVAIIADLYLAIAVENAIAAVVATFNDNLAATENCHLDVCAVDQQDDRPVAQVSVHIAALDVLAPLKRSYCYCNLTMRGYGSVGSSTWNGAKCGFNHWIVFLGVKTDSCIASNCEELHAFDQPSATEPCKPTVSSAHGNYFFDRVSVPDACDSIAKSAFTGSCYQAVERSASSTLPASLSFHLGPYQRHPTFSTAGSSVGQDDRQDPFDGRFLDEPIHHTSNLPDSFHHQEAFVKNHLDFHLQHRLNLAANYSFY